MAHTLNLSKGTAVMPTDLPGEVLHHLRLSILSKPR